MITKIESDSLSIAIANAGAELKSITNKKNNKEYLWQGSPEFWPRRAPVLFPIVGKLHKNMYTVEGQTYMLPQHGFARDKEFTVLSKKNDEVTFSLKSNMESSKVFPWDFELRVSYKVEKNKLVVGYKVLNTDETNMYFSIGGHPGFVCPLNDGESFTDYYLEFEKPETLDRHLLEEGLLNGTTEPVLKGENKLNLTEDLFKKDAIVFKGMKSSVIHLKSKKSDYSLKFSFTGFPFFGIWKKTNAPFICLEPWNGIADSVGFSGEFKNKEGIIDLPKSKEFNAAFEVEIG